MTDQHYLLVLIELFPGEESPPGRRCLDPLRPEAGAQEMPLTGKAKANYQRAYMRTYMRRQRAKPPNQQIAVEQRLTEAWQRLAATTPAPTPRHCLFCEKPVGRRYACDENERYFVCEDCIAQAYRRFSRSGA
jgi:hypothetical protein